MTLRPGRSPSMARRVRDGALWAVFGLIAFHRLRQAFGGNVHGADFMAVWEAARNLAHGAALYDPEGFGFVYLPSSAVLFLPFEPASFDLARDVWAVVAVASLGLSCVIVVRTFGGRPSWLAPASAAIMVGSAPALGVFGGNADLVLPLVLALSLHAVARARWQAVGVLSGVSLAIKPMVVAPVLLLAWERRWRATALCVAVPLLLSIPALALTPGSWTFLSQTVPFLARGENERVQDVSVAIASGMRDEPIAVQAVVRGAVLLLAVGAAVLVWRRAAPFAVRWLETVVAVQTGLTLLGGFGFAHHAALVLLLLPAAASPASLTRRLPVLASVLLFALPRAPPGSADFDHALALQGRIALVLVLVSMAATARWSRGYARRSHTLVS
jgi:arabinofuranan 3-O-arabinosyltransferase